MIINKKEENYLKIYHKIRKYRKLKPRNEEKIIPDF